ncbi:MAG: DUF2029 domain-containing protein [Bdellovibrionales bacterium]|nr:DUF2029 domain-containing protein [Bdellovibrionales bacterium]
MTNLRKFPLVPLAYIAALMLWGGWLFNVTLGQGAIDRAGQVIGTDFVMFYAAGHSLAEGAQARLYDFAYQYHLQQSLIGAKFSGTYNFYVSPFAAILYAPFAGFSYLTAFVLWTLLGLVLLWNALRFLGFPFPVAHMLLSLTFFPVFAAATYGQNSLLSLFVLSGVYLLWKRGAGLEAGLLSAVLAYKPQLLLGVIVLWLVLKARRELLGLMCGLVFAGAVCALVMPDAVLSYLLLAKTRFAELTTEASFPVKKQVSVYGFFYLLLGRKVFAAKVLALLTGAAAVIMFVRANGGRQVSEAYKFSSAVLLTFFLSPHMMIYEMTLLLIPAVLLWREAVCSAEILRSYNLVVWVAAFISIGAVGVQLESLGFALQPATLAVILVSADLWLRRR